MESLLQFDQALFSIINGAHNAFFDNLMLLLSNKFTWIPVYTIIFYFIVKNWGWKEAALVLVTIAILILITDQLSASLIKPWIQRLRPCQADSFFGGEVYTINGKCGGRYGFVSSHATNFFALATFLSILFKKNWIVTLCFLSAAFVGYSRIYLGVHYPGDVICGALLGILVASAVTWGYHLLRKHPFIAGKA